MSLKKKIQNLSDEVTQLHPVLYRLFSSLPQVKKVSYTQGPNEMGADFVLTREDVDLQQEENIGVVVKSGSIGQKNTEVDRQIEECRVPRLIEGKQVVLNAVWVVCNGTISKNAQEKMLAKHSATNVKFLGLDSLVQLVDRHMDGSIDEVPVYLQDHRTQLELEIMAFESAEELVPGLSSLFVEPDIAILAYDSAGFLKRDRVFSDFRAFQDFVVSKRRTLIQGRMGGGKSKILRQLALSIIHGEEYSCGECFPISLTAAKFIEDILSDSSLLSKYVPEKFDETQGEVVLIIDGLDEVEMDDDKILEALEKFEVDFRENENVHLLLSSRSLDRYNVELQEFMRTFERLEVQPLKGKRALDFLAQVADLSSITDRVRKDLSANSLVRAFDSTPIAYILLGSLLKQNSKDLPATIPDLFERYFTVALGKWEIEKGLLQQKESEVMAQGLERVSERMHEAGFYELAYSEVVDIFGQYISERDISGLDPSQIVDKLCSRCMVLCRLPKSGTVAFRHRSYLQFFQSKTWIRTRNHALDYSAFFPQNVTSVYFYLGLLKDCPHEIDTLANLEIEEDLLRLSRVVHFGNFLQAAYTTPSVSRKQALFKIVSDASKLYFDILNGRVLSPLSEFSPIHLLGFFRNVIVDVYSYADFSLHAEELAYELLDKDVSEENALSIFFLLIIKAEHDKDLSFAEFIDSYGAKLPTIIKLAVKHEEELRFKTLTRASKKMAKRFRSALKNNPAARKFISSLYNKSISEHLGSDSDKLSDTAD